MNPEDVQRIARQRSTYQTLNAIGQVRLYASLLMDLWKYDVEASLKGLTVRLNTLKLGSLSASIALSASVALNGSSTMVGVTKFLLSI